MSDKRETPQPRTLGQGNQPRAAGKNKVNSGGQTTTTAETGENRRSDPNCHQQLFQIGSNSVFMARPTIEKYVYREYITNNMKAVWLYLCIPHAGSASGSAAEHFSLQKRFLSSDGVSR